MGLEIFNKNLFEMYEIYDFHHSCAILANDFEEQLNDIIAVLEEFRLLREDIVAKGGSKSPIAGKIDSAFSELGWEEKGYDTSVMINGVEEKTPTHKFDCVKGRIALEIQWNNKDPFFDRDLRNFRNLFEKGAISVGVLITRSSELQEIFKILDKGSSYGASTTHMNKLMDRVDNRGAGGCPLLIIGISPLAYRESGDESHIQKVDEYNKILIESILNDVLDEKRLISICPYEPEVYNLNKRYISNKFINRKLDNNQRLEYYSQAD